jgi:hypothetical protein
VSIILAAPETAPARKKLPLHPTPFATLEIETTSSQRTGNKKPPSAFHFQEEMKPPRWLFHAPNPNGWTYLPITPLERHI